MYVCDQRRPHMYVGCQWFPHMSGITLASHVNDSCTCTGDQLSMHVCWGLTLATHVYQGSTMAANVFLGSAVATNLFW